MCRREASETYQCVEQTGFQAADGREQGKAGAVFRVPCWVEHVGVPDHEHICWGHVLLYPPLQRSWLDNTYPALKPGNPNRLGCRVRIAQDIGAPFDSDVNRKSPPLIRIQRSSMKGQLLGREPIDSPTQLRDGKQERQMSLDLDGPNKRTPERASPDRVPRRSRVPRRRFSLVCGVVWGSGASSVGHDQKNHGRPGAWDSFATFYMSWRYDGISGQEN